MQKTIKNLKFKFKIFRDNHSTYYMSHTTRRGFGIIEVAISVGILLVVVSAAAVLEKNAIKNSVIASERTQAYNLAREGIEAVRAIRDSSWIDNDPNTTWNSSFTAGDHDVVLNSVGRWELPNQIGAIPLNSVNFSRKITFQQVGDQALVNANLRVISDNPTLNDQAVNFNDFIIKVTVEVGWTSYGKPNSVTTYEYLTDWKPVY